jgi:hypothetical protein
MMQEILIKKLHDYIRDNNPDLLLILLEENRLTDYLQENVASINDFTNQLLSENKDSSIIEELCLEELTRTLLPSRFNYLATLLEDEFQHDRDRLEQAGVLTTELINMIAACDPVFEEMEFSAENEDDRYLRYAIMGAIHEYFNVNVVLR